MWTTQIYTKILYVQTNLQLRSTNRIHLGIIGSPNSLTLVRWDALQRTPHISLASLSTALSSSRYFLLPPNIAAPSSSSSCILALGEPRLERSGNPRRPAIRPRRGGSRAGSQAGIHAARDSSSTRGSRAGDPGGDHAARRFVLNEGSAPERARLRFILGDWRLCEGRHDSTRGPALQWCTEGAASSSRFHILGAMVIQLSRRRQSVLNLCSVFGTITKSPIEVTPKLI